MPGKKLTRRQLLKTGAATAAVLAAPRWVRAQPRPVKLAVLLPLTGPFAFAGAAALEAFQDAVGLVNDELGGIAGRPLELIVEDTGYDVAKGTAAFNRVVNRERPDELLFVYGDSTGLSKALAPEITRLGLPYTATSYSGELADPERYPTIYVFGPTYQDMMEALLREIAARKPGARIALVYSNSEFGRDPIPYVKRRAAALELEIVAEEVTPLVLTDAGPVVLKLQRARADYVLTQGYVATAEPALLKAAREFGFRATFMGTYYSASNALIQRAGPAADGFLATYHNAYWYEVDVPGIRRARAYRRQKGRPNKPMTTYYVGAFFVGLTVAEAMRRAAAANRLSREGVLEALGNLADYDAFGLIHSLRFVRHRLPYTKLYRADARARRYVPYSDWIQLA